MKIGGKQRKRHEVKAAMRGQAKEQENQIVEAKQAGVKFAKFKVSPEKR